MLLKCCTQYASNNGKLSSGHRTRKVQFSFQSQRKECQRMFKFPHNCTHFTCYQEIMLKILQVRLQEYINGELSDVQAGFRKGRGTRDQIANIRWIIEKAGSSWKTSTSALLTMPKPLTMWITTNCGKFWKRWEYQTTWPASWEICMQVKCQQLELDMEQETGSKSGKEYLKAVYCHPAHLTYMQRTSCEMLDSMNHKLE